MILPKQPLDPQASTSEQAPYQQQVLNQIKAVSYLPTTVAVALKFIALGKDPEAGPPEYVKVISSDSSLSTKLLALANSSWFGVRHRVTKVGVAVNLLGLGTVRTLAISFCAAGLHHSLRLTPSESRTFWMACLSKAVAARRLALLSDPQSSEEAFACGLFQHLALPFMYAVAKQPLLSLLHEGGEAQHQLHRERAMFRLDHAELGRAITQRIELPQLFVDAVALHHNRQALSQVLAQPALADAAYAASLFPHLLERWNPHDAQTLRQFLLERYHLKLEAFLPDVQREFDELYAYFENGTPSQATLPALLEEAAVQIADNTAHLVGTVQSLMRETAQAGRQVREAMIDQTQMERQVMHDPLTGLLNRAGLIRQATELIAQWHGTAPLAVAFMDIDRFKTINDTAGHAGGDDALRAVASVLAAQVRHADAVARIGGDEFVLILGNCQRASALAAVRRIVHRVARRPMSCAGSLHRVTVSAGLVWLPVAPSPQTLEQLLVEADALMYQAKRAGGDRLQWRCGQDSTATATPTH